ncbi:venom dipeptidyl peptidase 4-like [Aricia agestis]|uniref:venom dipeptidyl peptidase 4-like n=1 Tax=Aricia agestis TaxID=91739 RepID=UPI001C206480|nr:venom dipeptidyl peptidase 4-like [Aricia agestis]
MLRYILSASVLAWCVVATPSPQSFLKTFALEELVPLQHAFFPARLAAEWVSDTEYIVMEPTAVNKYDALTDNYVTLLDQADLVKLGRYVMLKFSSDQKYLLLADNLQKIYRYSSIGDYFIYNLEDKSISKLGKGPLQVVVWSGSSLAYVQDNNVYYVADASRPDAASPLTTEGVPGEVYYGATDWIYEEEIFDAAEGLWFSPNGAYLAVASFNDTLVESAIYPYYGTPSNISNQYIELVSFKYPKAGRTNPKVGLRVYKLDEKDSKTFAIPVPIEVVGQDYILGNVKWATDENVVVLWLNRRQNTSSLINCNLRENKCSILKQQNEPDGWIDISDPLFDASGLKMLQIQPLYFEKNRFMHVARFDFNTLVIEDLSPGNATVMKILGWDQETDSVYYIVSPGTEPWQRQLWVTKKGVPKCISCRHAHCNNVDGDFSSGGSYGIITCSAINYPPTTYLYNARSNQFRLLSDNVELAERLKKYRMPMVLFNKLKLAGGVPAHIKLLLPPEMEAGRKYPMIVRVYAGPGTTRVKDSYDLEYYSTYLASNRSMIVGSVDVRGSGAMGVDNMHAVNNALGTIEVTDTLAAIKKLISQYDFIDPQRVGVWGWSYGGYATTMMLIKDEDRTLACGAAVAPVTSWLYYDTIYTERYMDTPANNPAGYARGDVIPQAGKLRGRRYLIVHGTGDDNVHFQHSLQLAKQLQLEDIEFEQMSYTDENHSLRSVSRHFYHTLDRFWTSCFK